MAKNKTASISVAVFPEVKERWEQEALKREMTLAQFIRKVVNAYVSAVDAQEKLKKQGKQ